MVNAKAGTPGEALNFLVALRTLMRHAITAGLRADDPTIGVRAPKYRSAGFYTWTEEDIAAFEAGFAALRLPQNEGWTNWLVGSNAQ